MEKRNAHVYDDESLALTGRVLDMNPEFYTMWNFRHEILHTMLQSASSDEEKKQKLLDELSFTEKAIAQNPKVYIVWHHRRWVLKQLGGSYGRELALCAKFLTMDDRNFHCWGHRKQVAQWAEKTVADELAFTLEKVNQNFSNYSAWHYRSVLLSNTFEREDQGNQALLHELELVKQAFYTEPEDQSAWLYLRWLLRGGAGDIQDILRAQLAVCDELLELESDDSKWALLMSVFILRSLGDPEEWVNDMLERLKRVDPARKNYYADLMHTKSQRRIKSVTFQGGIPSLEEGCCQ
eukprot:TRINITY_DN3951_c0_g1_i1.p1 TRINITY_DN3951_c0_g1~~TRINITY_DN3951_c0_g1_i1.p1  ORF type:complete len:331 (-),score=40.51 TRINITY_DN3951_c0_g1_i1:17-898(-)